ncbi:MAG TPA: hypothetical protein VLA09_08915 [Longimicrobiales bacterium]|nr:hypothetical protein [Longimicrobiales bacterium]
MAHRLRRSAAALPASLAMASLALAHPAVAQAPPQWEGVPPVRLSEGVTRIHTADEPNVAVRVLTTGLSHPWSLAIAPRAGPATSSWGR